MRRYPNKKKGMVDKSNLGWIRHALYGRVHVDELWKWFMTLNEKDRLDYLAKIAPKEIETKGETGVTVTFKLNGVREDKAIPGEVVKAIGCSSVKNGCYENDDE